MKPYASINGHGLNRVRLTVANTGPWTAECDFEDAPEVSGRVTLSLGGLQLSGTVEPRSSGTFSGQRRLRLVAGAGGWGNEVAAKDYHNDARIRAVTIAQDAAREVGEELGTFVPAAERIGIDYVRQVGPASRVLEDVIGAVAWWVDFNGVTHVGTRPEVAVDEAAYQVLAYDPRERLVTLTADDPSVIGIGSVLTEHLDVPQAVRDLELEVTNEDLRIYAWCGGTEAGRGRLAGLIRSIVQRATDGRLWGPYRYRVVRMAVDRVELQAVRRAVGLPDVLPVSMWPGIPGAYAQLTPGAEVLVEFVEGDRTMPIVTHFGGKGAPGFAPVSLTLGGESGSPAARQGDVVEVQLPPATFSGTVGGSPASGLLTFTPAKALGVITGGSSKVKVAT